MRKKLSEIANFMLSLPDEFYTGRTLLDTFTEHGFSFLDRQQAGNCGWLESAPLSDTQTNASLCLIKKDMIQKWIRENPELQ